MTTSTGPTFVRHALALFLSLAVLGSPFALAPALAAPSKAHGKVSAKVKSVAAKAKPGGKEKDKHAVEAPRPAPSVAAAPTPPPSALPPPPAAAPAPVGSSSIFASTGGASTPSPSSAPVPVDAPAGPPTATPLAVPPAVEPPAPVPISYAEHLSGEAYPDQLRGLYGGSMWLEPSFHGLQWPYMPRTGLGLSGYAWTDTGYETLARGAPNVPDTNLWVQQARAALRATPTYSNQGFFVQAQLELVGNKDQVHAQADKGSGIVDVDDLWVRVGRWNQWDLKVGRYEGWEVYHTGMGLDINTIERRGATQAGVPNAGNFERPDYYGVTLLHDRPSGQGVGNVALHLFPTSYLRFELLGQLGTSDYLTQGDNTLGARPVGILDLGRIKIKIGAEYQRTKPATKEVVSTTDASGNTTTIERDYKNLINQRGVGAAVQFILTNFLEGGVNVGLGEADRYDMNGNAIDTDATTTKSVGGFLNLAPGKLLGPKLEDLLIGLGGNWTTRVDLHKDTDGRIDYTANLQTFAAVQYLVAKQLFVKAVVAYARSDFDLSFSGGVYSNTMMSGRLRLMYLF